MSGFLLDTNVLSETRRLKPSPSVIAFLTSTSADDLYVSEVTFAEIRFGIETVPDPARRRDLSDWLQHTLRPEFHGRTIPISEDVMLRWRILVEDGRKANHTYSQPDLIIGATALQHGMTLVTRNTADFDRAGLSVLNPWTSPVKGVGSVGETPAGFQSVRSNS